MKRLLACLIMLSLCLTALPAFAEESVTARTTLNVCSDDQRCNIALAVQAINGTTVAYGCSFSFNDVVGPRTRAFGYVPALNGRGAEVTGGGVAQVASTLYRTLEELDAGSVYYDEIHTYGKRFRGSYVSDGDQAILVDHSADTDFVFTNFTEDMTIEMWTTDNHLYCALTLSSPTSGWSGSGNDWSFGWNAEESEKRYIVASSSIYLQGSEGMINNVSLAAASINDTVLPSGAVFSFNDIVGPRGERYGYQSALNGRGAKVVGGGVAQVASALWLAVKNLDCVSVIEKSTYGQHYNQNYVQSSNDAILIDYGAGTDFSFRNNGSMQLTLSTYIANGVLHCDIYQN